ncbi:MAG: IS5 family transposase [Verrucomicrobiae bacterium]|nr:IS5 family transposase [Verrucomicrobiae bacterium]
MIHCGSAFRRSCSPFKPLVQEPRPKRGRGRPPKEDRLMLEAMLFVLRVACPWRDLPDYFGPWSSVYTRWRRWNLNGVWAAILDLLKEGATGTLSFLDATHVKAHQDSTQSAAGKEREGIGKTKGGLNTKLTALVDSKGRATQITLQAGNMADITAADTIEIPAGLRIVADKGYDSAAFRQRIADAGSRSCIPPRKTRKNRVPWHRGHYRKRHRIENFFQRIKRFRRVGTRYEKHAVHFLAFVQLAAIMDWLKSPF